jgi:hypothetical protein
MRKSIDLGFTFTPIEQLTKIQEYFQKHPTYINITFDWGIAPSHQSSISLTYDCDDWGDADALSMFIGCIIGNVQIGVV